MKLWPVAALGSACGFVSVLGVFFLRGFRRRQWKMDLSTALVIFLSTGTLPTAVTFFLYPFPFIDPKPDLSEHYLYLPVAGFGILWLVFETLKKAYDGDIPNGG